MKQKLKYLLVLLVFFLVTAFFQYAPVGSDPMGAYLNGVFPTTVPGEGTVWDVEELFPGQTFDSPVRMLSFPGTDDLLIQTKVGEIWRMSMDGSSRELLLDIKDRVFKLGESGSVGMVLHPEFGNPSAPNKQYVYVFYRTKPNVDPWEENGFNRLSRFTWDPVTETFDPDSEFVLIQQYDRKEWHNGGAMFFDRAGFLYLSLGDEGKGEFREISTQRLDGGFFSGVLRIDVDNNPARSHPIRRQPLPNAPEPVGWGETFSQGYSIPNDNPWQDPEGGVLEEFFAIGLRSPYTMHFDPETQEIWVADVGAATREEVSLLEKGDNLQWPYREGTFEVEDMQKPDSVIGSEKAPFYEPDRKLSVCIIGGGIYRGSLFPELNGKYIYADYVFNNLVTLTNQGSNAEPEDENLLSIAGRPDLPEKAGITGLFFHPNGQILISVKGEDLKNSGKIFFLKRRQEVPEPPAKLSELGVFEDLESLTPIPGIIPYKVNAPLWSDRALKKRWMAIPGDGIPDQAEERISFSANKDWEFPEGTVFIKHFELPMTTEPGGPLRRLETRFFILGENGVGYGLTYKWNEQGTEAYLLGGGATQDFPVYQGEQVAFAQTWDFPSRGQCMNCHTANAHYVLGVKTHQLNGELFYPDIGRSMNQLDYLNQMGLFQRNIGNPDNYLQTYAIGDESVDLETRIRSYLDANCASCHRPGGVDTELDLRYTVPLELQNLINQPTQSLGSDPNRRIVEPGFHASSELWVRDASLDGNQMPPLARNLIDRQYVDLLAEWIDGLEEDAGRVTNFLLYPNPSQGFVTIRVNDDWAPPYSLSIWNSNGQLISRSTENSNSISLDLSEQQTGVYILEVEAGGKKVVKRLMVK